MDINKKDKEAVDCCTALLSVHTGHLILPVSCHYNSPPHFHANLSDLCLCH